MRTVWEWEDACRQRLAWMVGMVGRRTGSDPLRLRNAASQKLLVEQQQQQRFNGGGPQRRDVRAVWANRAPLRSERRVVKWAQRELVRHDGEGRGGEAPEWKLIMKPFVALSLWPATIISHLFGGNNWELFLSFTYLMLGKWVWQCVWIIHTNGSFCLVKSHVTLKLHKGTPGHKSSWQLYNGGSLWLHVSLPARQRLDVMVKSCGWTLISDDPVMRTGSDCCNIVLVAVQRRTTMADFTKLPLFSPIVPYISKGRINPLIWRC